MVSLFVRRYLLADVLCLWEPDLSVHILLELNTCVIVSVPGAVQQGDVLDHRRRLCARLLPDQRQQRPHHAQVFHQQRRADSVQGDDARTGRICGLKSCLPRPRVAMVGNGIFMKHVCHRSACWRVTAARRRAQIRRS